MRPHFYVYDQDSGGVVVKAEEFPTPFRFAHILEALAFVRRHRGEDGVAVSYYDVSGRLVFSRLLE